MLKDKRNILVNLNPLAATFSNVNLVDLGKAQDNFETALSKVKYSTPADTAAKNQLNIILENELIIAAYQCVEDADSEVAVFLLSGFEIKSKSSPSGNLDSQKL